MSRSHPPRPRVRPAIARLGLVAASLLAGLYLADLAFRAFFLLPAVPRSDDQFQAVVAAVWPRPIPASKPAGTVRVVGLADSFGVNGGERNFHYLVEAELRARGLPVEVVNLSVGAYSLVEEQELLARFGPRYQPDIVLHSFFVGNDFALGDGRALRYRGIDVVPAPGWRSWLPHNLLLLPWLGRHGEAVADGRRRDAEMATGEVATFSRERFLWVEAVRLATFRRPEADGEAWPGATRYLDSIRAETRAMGAVPVLVVHPDQLQIEPALFDEVVGRYALEASHYDLELPRGFLAAWGESRRVPVLDLTPAMRENGRDGGLYRPRDTHYSDRGNQLAAAAIVHALEPLIIARLTAARAAGPAAR